jgi:hypothetical protein
MGTTGRQIPERIKPTRRVLQVEAFAGRDLGKKGEEGE